MPRTRARHLIQRRHSIARMVARWGRALEAKPNLSSSSGRGLPPSPPPTPTESPERLPPLSVRLDGVQCVEGSLSREFSRERPIFCRWAVDVVSVVVLFFVLAFLIFAVDDDGEDGGGGDVVFQKWYQTEEIPDERPLHCTSR